MSTRTPKKRLGRGLSSLISSPSSEAKSRQARTFFLCPIESIFPMRGQPRRVFDDARLDELAESIKANGVIQPLVVRASATDDGTYTLIAGERRWRASQRAGLTEVPVVVKELSDEHAFEMALVENIQREDLNAIEEAEAYKRLIDEFSYTQEALAERVGRSRSAVANALRLLKLTPEVQELVADSALSAGHARAVLSVDPDKQARLADQILKERLSVRQAEERSRRMKGIVPTQPVAVPVPVSPEETPEVQAAHVTALEEVSHTTEPSPEVREDLGPAVEQVPPPRTDGTGVTPMRPQLRRVQRKLIEALGSRVEIVERRDGSGHVAIHFADPSGLQAIVDQILESQS